MLAPIEFERLVATRAWELGTDTQVTVGTAAGVTVIVLDHRERSVAFYVHQHKLQGIAAQQRLWTTMRREAKKLQDETLLDLPASGGERFRLMSAVHEGAHAICALSLNVGVRRSSVQVARRWQQATGGETAFVVKTPDPTPMHTLLLHCVIAAAGPMGPVVLLRHPDEFGRYDDAQIRQSLTWMGFRGSERDQLHERVRSVAATFLNQPHVAAQVEIAACLLLERKTVSGEELLAACAAHQLPITPWTEMMQRLSGLTDPPGPVQWLTAAD